MLEEPPVLCGEHGLNEELRHLVDLHHAALFGGLIVDACQDLRLELERVDGLAGIEPGDGGHALPGDFEPRGKTRKRPARVAEVPQEHLQSTLGGLIAVLARVRDLSVDAAVVEAAQALNQIQRRDLASRVDRERIGVDLGRDFPAPARKALDQLVIEPAQSVEGPPSGGCRADEQHDRRGEEPADSSRTQSFGILRDEFLALTSCALRLVPPQRQEDRVVAAPDEKQHALALLRALHAARYAAASFTGLRLTSRMTSPRRSARRRPRCPA